MFRTLFRGRVDVYPVLQDETCFFVAADFDKNSWPEDTRAFMETCNRMNLPAALERSPSGYGGHVWLFFEEAIPAALARKLASHMLTETMENRPDMGLDSYDRFIPGQDTLPKGGFGNLIALPLQKQPRLRGNSVFLDERLSPYHDQWAIPYLHVYGYPKMFKIAIGAWRSERDERLGKRS